MPSRTTPPPKSIPEGNEHDSRSKVPVGSRVFGRPQLLSSTTVVTRRGEKRRTITELTALDDDMSDCLADILW